MACEKAEPVDFNLPYLGSVAAIWRTWSKKNQSDSEQKTDLRYFVTSMSIEEKSRIGSAVRGHWSIENRNHYKRDVSSWREDNHCHRRPNAALNLALTRNALLALIPFQEREPLAHYFELYSRDRSKAIKLLLRGIPLP
jgi:predicted transposase YbfD/YdcC